MAYFYPDDISQQVALPNASYFDLSKTQPELQTFIDRNKDNALVKERMSKPIGSAFEYDVIRFSYKVYCMIDAAERCATDVFGDWLYNIQHDNARIKKIF